ncbi:MAG: alanine--glyoxylate aminotransferase family protein [Candidatus Omnitrophota bacterium]
MSKKYLLTPGPTPVPPASLEAMARPIIHHRTSQFQEILKEVEEDLQYVFQTKEKVFILTSSGTGAMEGTVCNLLSPGDRAIVVRAGKFGERWGELCEAYGIEYIPVDVEWGKAVDPNDIKKLLDADKKIKAVYVTLCETSTGVSTDIKTIASIAKNTEAVLVVDAISALGAVELKTDEWGIDVVVSGSQKGLMIPPGLAFVSLSKKAYSLVERSTLPKYYFNFKAYKKSIDKNDTPYTPAVNLIIGLNEALKIIKKEGLENVIARHKRYAVALRKTVKALGLGLLSPDAYSDAVTAVKLPESVDGGKLVKIMRDKYGVAVAGGQGHLKGKIFRIATMGYITKEDLTIGIATLETVLEELGYKFEKGIGSKTFEEALR